MPPVMGAVAFIMAEMIGVEYVEVARAALIPPSSTCHVRFGWCIWRQGDWA